MVRPVGCVFLGLCVAVWGLAGCFSGTGTNPTAVPVNQGGLGTGGGTTGSPGNQGQTGNEPDPSNGGASTDGVDDPSTGGEDTSTNGGDTSTNGGDTSTDGGDPDASTDGGSDSGGPEVSLFIDNTAPSVGQTIFLSCQVTRPSATPALSFAFSSTTGGAEIIQDGSGIASVVVPPGLPTITYQCQAQTPTGSGPLSAPVTINVGG
ncbi:MAG: hypothetical protein ACE5GE_12250 [Phycisphaerae bacterium]